MNNISAVKWTMAFTNNLPDSSFAYIEPGGKKDYSGKTEPRVKRHLPYKDASGKINLPHLMNAIARLGVGKPFVMSENVRNRVKSRLQIVFARHNKSLQDIEQKEQASLEPIQLTYTASFKAKIVEIDGKKTALISGTLMDDSINKNFWRLKSEEHNNIAKEVSGVNIKVQHSENDWQIVGSGDEGTTSENKVIYSGTVTDKYAVEKFESKTWNDQNMGVSPRIDIKDVTCSICGKSARRNHIHIRGEKYDGKVCFYDAVGAHLNEISLTSNPAYKPSAGTIDFVGLTAELEKFVKNTEEKNMGDSRDSLEAVILEKDTKIEELLAETKLKDTKIKELESTVETKEKEEEKKKEEVKAMKKELNEFVSDTRKVELEKRITDKDLVAKILAQEMTNEQFKAEIEKIDAIQKTSVATNAASGSAPADSPDNLKAREEKIGKDLFGEDYKGLLGESD